MSQTTTRYAWSLSIIARILLIAAAADAAQLESHVIAAQALEKQSDLFRAELQLQAALSEARNGHSETFELARALALLGVFYQDVGRFSESKSCFVQSLKILTVIGGQQDESQAAVISHLARLYVETGRTAQAERLRLSQYWVPTLEKSRSKYLPSVLESVAGLFALQGNFSSADLVFQREFDLLTERGELLSMDMASALNNFGFIQIKARRYDDAQKSFERAMQQWTKLSGVDDLQVGITRFGLAQSYAYLGRYEESSEMFNKALPIFEKRCGPLSLRTADVLINFAKVLQHQKRKTDARNLEDRARRIREYSASHVASRFD